MLGITAARACFLFQYRGERDLGKPPNKLPAVEWILVPLSMGKSWFVESDQGQLRVLLLHSTSRGRVKVVSCLASLALQRPGRSYRPTSRPTAKSRILSLLQLQIFFSKESLLD